MAKLVPGLDAIMPPLAGMSDVSRGDFLTYDAGGSALWVGLYIFAGALFTAELDRVARVTSILAGALILVLGTLTLLFFVWRLAQLYGMIRALRGLSISPGELKARIDAGGEIGLVDLLRFEDDLQESSCIPGAVRVNPMEMRNVTRIVLPEGLDLVVYCNSKDNFVSAHVAAALRRRGIRRIRVLEGGLAGWKARDFPMSAKPVDLRTEWRRLGIDLFPLLSNSTSAAGPAYSN